MHTQALKNVWINFHQLATLVSSRDEIECLFFFFFIFFFFMFYVLKNNQKK